MNLKLEDLSQYIVVIIFILIIFKVLGSGFITSLHELFTGKKQEDDFDIDSLINKKKNQFNLSPTLQSQSLEDTSLRAKVQALESDDKEKMMDLLKSLEWGDIDSKYIRNSKELLGDTSNTRGLSHIVKFFFERTLEENKDNLLKVWTKVYDNSVLWTNLLNSSKNIDEQKALLSFKYSKFSTILNLEEHSIRTELEKLLLPAELLTIKFIDKEFSEVETEEIFEQYQEKLNLFKRLRPISPTSKENTKKWALEVLEVRDQDVDEKVVKEAYKKITSKIHPDKFSSLNLSDDQISILNSNLATVNKAYAQLKK
ncbi:hypothetical protein [Halobacteriovorax sp. JY17]|uniref:J domain-containing protein n=1 Tax=Halobacteriovorax sp. JY17 TaxID=2014617 RepID=UPI0025C718F7|nr:hypothetical protein [Halobacteriovorax sp. JY17]